MDTEDADEGAVNKFFKYGDADLPAYRDDKGFMICTAKGERPVDDLVKFTHEATPITEAEFDALKAKLG